MTFPKTKIWKCHFFVVPLQKIWKGEGDTMKVKWAGIVDDMKGYVDKEFYARHEVNEMIKRGEEIKP